MNRLVFLSLPPLSHSHYTLLARDCSGCEVIPIFFVPALLIVAEPYSRLYLFNAMLRSHSAMEISNLSRSSHETKRERESEKVSVKSRKSDKIRSCFVSMCELYPFECGAFLLYCAVLFRSQAYMCQPIKCLSCSATHLLIECSK